MNESFRMSTWGSYHTGMTLNYPVFKNYNANGPKIDPSMFGKEFMSDDPDRADDVRKNLFFYDYESDTKSFVTKYQFQSQDPDSEDPYAQFSESNILIFRLADMYLLRAEANAKMGNGSIAVEDLNMVRGKANVPAYTGATDRESMMKAIFEERAIEFIGEAHASYDRIRMDYFFDGVSWVNSKRISKRGYFWPVSTGIISKNPSIVQTEFWQGRL